MSDFTSSEDEAADDDDQSNTTLHEYGLMKKAVLSEMPSQKNILMLIKDCKIQPTQ